MQSAAPGQTKLLAAMLGELQGLLGLQHGPHKQPCLALKAVAFLHLAMILQKLSLYLHVHVLDSGACWCNL